MQAIFFFKTVEQTIFFLIFLPADNFFYQIRYPPVRKIMVRPLYILEISWKLYAGKFLETMCWEIWVDAGGFFDGVIMAQCYGIILWFQGNGTWSSVEHSGSADLSKTKPSEASEVIGRVRRGMGMRNQALEFDALPCINKIKLS